MRKAARKSTVKKTAKKAVRRPAKKIVRRPAKHTAKKAVARKAPAKKAVAKKVVARKATGKKPGKKRLLTNTQIVKLKQMRKTGKHTVEQLCRMFKISVPTFYNYLKVKAR